MYSIPAVIKLPSNGVPGGVAYVKENCNNGNNIPNHTFLKFHSTIYNLAFVEYSNKHFNYIK